MTDLRWISWEQHGDAERDPDCRPVAWPPPPEVTPPGVVEGRFMRFLKPLEIAS